MKLFDVAILGATGEVGKSLLSILEERQFPVGTLYPLASSRTAGERIVFRGQELVVLDASAFDFSKVQIGFFSAGAAVSEIYAPKAAACGCLVIDNTSQFRYDDDVPLVVPEVNRHAIAGFAKRRIIANPNCSTAQMLVALKPIHDAVGISRINVATYQSVSGTGKEAIEELSTQTRQLLNGHSPSIAVYPVQIAFNLIPQIDVFLDNGYTKEEMKMVWETQKIMDPTIAVNATAVRVPVFYGHSEAVHLETQQPISVDEVRRLLAQAPGVCLKDNRQPGGYPTPVVDAAGDDATWVGRIRKDLTHPNGLNLWIVSDNIRKGAALNSIQIAECWIEDGFAAA